MPDIGGFGRGLLKGALSATEKAAEKVKDAAEAASRRMADQTPDTAQAPESEDPDATQVIANVETVDDPEITQVIPGSQTSATAPAGATRQSPVADMAPATSQNDGQSAIPHHGDQLSSLAQDPGLTAPDAAPASGRPARNPSPADVAPAGEPSLADEPDERADESDVRQLVEMFRQLLARRRPPAGPIPGDWSIGVGDLLAEHPKVPKRVHGLVVRLNRFGGVAYSPHAIAFDGDDVPWEKVTELRTRHVVDYLVGDAVQQQVENLPVPWFPGRKRLLDALGQALLTITIATAKNQLDRFELDLRVPAEVVYKASFGRTRELNAGVVSALVLADPAVNQSVIATARARGVAVTAGADELLAGADERAAKIREKVRALEAELERFSRRFGRSG
jgi:hypothetical protein